MPRYSDLPVETVANEIKLMRILFKYFLKEFLKFFSIIIFAITAILLIAEFFDKVDEFYAKNPPVYLVLEYLLLQSPRFLLFASPPASLLSILLTIGIASKWRETVVIQASGESIRRVFSYFLIIGVVISLLAFILSEGIVPIAMKKASWIRNVKILQRESKISYRDGAMWLKGLDGSLIYIKDFIVDEEKILKISIFSFNPSFELTKRIEAESAEWLDGRWELEDVTIYDFNDKTTKTYKSLVSQAVEDPKIFKEEIRKPEEMSFIELYTYYKRLEKTGFKNVKYIVDLYAKLAYPMVNFVMILFGIGIALNNKLGGGIRSAGIGLVISLFYWLIYSVSLSLGNTGAIQPWLAPWIGPVVFGTAGSVMYLRIKE
ncbi:MAG: LptF/LptG family permease [Nitrospirae bacterium]|nr:LptF/LptG family permease [Nitrospirota bacterium]